MSTVLSPIAPDDPLCQTLTCLPEKFVVDFANGIDVVRDHLRVQNKRTSFGQRLYDGFSGQAARRQTAIQASLLDGVEASLNWLCELSEAVAHSNLAIAKVNDRVTALTQNLATVAHYSADTRTQLEQLGHRLDARMHDLAQEIQRIDFIQQVQLNLDEVFSKWAAGRFAALSPAARCYAALEELRWGALGDYCRASTARERERFMRLVTDRATQQLAQDVKSETSAVLDMRQVWLACPAGHRDTGDMVQALAYLADSLDMNTAPFAIGVTQEAAQLPLGLPLLAKAGRIAQAMTHEVFPQEITHV